MPANPRISAAFIDRIQALCTAAYTAGLEGIIVKTPSKAEAYKLRQNVYSARKALHQAAPQDKSPLSTVDMRIAETAAGFELRIFPQGASINKFEIVSAASGEAITIAVEHKHEYSFTEDQIFEKELEIAVARGPGSYRDAAITALKQGQ